jgi:hypothetical protein
VTFHIFILVWGKKFIHDFIEIALRFQMMSGNLPALAAQVDVHYHIYTDKKSQKFFETMQNLEAIASVHFHYLEDIKKGDVPLLVEAKKFRPPDYKYFIQKFCIRDMFTKHTQKDDAIIILDSNFIVADGGLGQLARTWKKGIRAVMVNVLRTTEDAFVSKWWYGYDRIFSRELYSKVRTHLHPLHQSYFTESTEISSYPTQVCWKVDQERIYARSFLPHPLMIPVGNEIKNFQSTPDYDLALRLCSDDQIQVCEDSDDILVCKISNINHGITTNSSLALTPQNLALFIITSTHHRHRNFVSIGNKYHCTDASEGWSLAESKANDLIDRAYREVDHIISLAPNLDVRFLMHIKSYLGPIEDYMSPELEPGGLKYWLVNTNQ